MTAQRERVSLPLGGGLDRSSGIMAVEPAAIEDLRNVDLRAGAATLRQGLTSRASSWSGGGTPTDIVAIHPVRSHGRGAVVTYDSASGLCVLWLTDADGSAPVYGTIVGSTVPGGPLPRFVLEDSYGKVFVAHDEVDIAFRCATLCFDLDTFAPVSMTLDGSATGFRFRGVARRLNYLVGWGWGSVADQDRPEILRISLPGEPHNFLTPHYFMVGQRREPITGCMDAGDAFAIRKLADSYQLNGYDRATFGVTPLDPLHGLVQPLMSVSVGGTNYFWSASGPRISTGGPSQDMAIPLDLDGPLPDTLATIDLDNAFAVYDHIEREVLFVFGQWAYVLHLADGNPRWSYRKYGLALTAGGTLYADRLPPVGTAPTATVVFNATAFPTKADGIWTSRADCTGPFNASDQVETWIREVIGPYANIWRKVAVTLINATSPLNISAPNVLYPGQSLDVAMRVCRAGVPGALYTATNPLSWPAGARKMAELDTLSAPTHASHVWAANGASPDTLVINVTPVPTWNSSPYDDHISYEAQVSDGAGGWINAALAAAPDTLIQVKLTLSDVTAYAGLTRSVRIRHKTTWVSSAWTTIAGVNFF